MNDAPIDIEKLRLIFFPFYMDRIDTVKRNNTRFVHYTNADTATKIIKNKKIWLRETSCMNDFLEVRHGLDCLFKAYGKKDGPQSQFRAALNMLMPELPGQVEKIFNYHLPSIQTNTYLSCFSEHESSEDLHGRLSMWRAYGGNNGIAIVIKNDAFLSEIDDFPIYSSPVEYLDENCFEERLNIISKNISDNIAYLKTFDSTLLSNFIFQMLMFYTLCTKHPGFKEEKEWRIICSPNIHPIPDYIEREVETINGTAQIICKIPLIDRPEINLVNIEIPKLLDKIIIGPTQYSPATYKAFVQLLRDAGVENAEGKVTISGIPLRN